MEQPMMHISCLAGPRTHSAIVPFAAAEHRTLGDVLRDAARGTGLVPDGALGDWKVEVSPDGSEWCAAQLQHPADAVVRGYRNSQLRFTLPDSRGAASAGAAVAWAPPRWAEGPLHWLVQLLRFVVPAVVMFFITISIFGSQDSSPAQLSASLRAAAAKDGLEVATERVLAALSDPQEQAAARRAAARFLAARVS
eukprot:TRINITY_DN57693_c0_g1_i1.p1 TRINITY_DN57693_c0_g1~~TRINITY_DN57693_c0_g1_i1.p1  ORF type:complete len:228 (+),score=73.26 TRINITY_DN57693_c0_g1_i1:100-684(+)